MDYVKFLTEHWLLISSIFVGLISILNALTKHFSEKKGFVKIVLFISEMLSILASAGTSVTGLKFPLQSVKPEKKEDK